MEPFLIPVLADVEPVLIPIVALMIPIVVVPTALFVRLAQKKREMEHRERMKALEMGRFMAGEDAGRVLGRIAAKIGAGVPIGSLGFAWIVGMTLSDNLARGALVGAFLVSVIAMICGTILALKSSDLAFRQRQDLHGNADAVQKPSFDPDVYDHVGSRG